MLRDFLLALLCLGPITATARAAELHDAAKTGDAAAIAALLDSGADVNESDGIAAPLLYALNKRHFEAAKLLILRGADVNTQSLMGGSPLLVAVAKGQSEMVKLLLSQGADPNMTPLKQAPIHLAVKQGCLDCLSALVEAGADVNARTTDGFARTPIHMARSQGYTSAADYLLAQGVVVPVPEPIDRALSGADPERGLEVFGRNCDGCHTDQQGGGTKQGPNLWSVVGRDKASVPDFQYSTTLQALEGSWTYQDLNVFLSDPVLTTPGVRMEVPGVRDPVERADLIAYLRTLSDDPMPLP